MRAQRVDLVFLKEKEVQLDTKCSLEEDSNLLPRSLPLRRKGREAQTSCSLSKLEACELAAQLAASNFAKGQEKPSNMRTNTAYACVSFKLDNSIRKPPLCPNTEMHVLSIADE
ncbi:hypothetical protein NC652_012066 [Populus alba x Populus x berolinensis]|nr:hypothetical protein NC652_012066 [Populus alba x Populus x berolinensis]